MAALLTSEDLLAHFDDSNCAAARDTAHFLPTRGVGWVLQWAAATATLFFAVSVLAYFGYCLAAELTLARAARAGVLEATLPRATYQSVVESVEQRLSGFSQLPGRLRLSMQQNGAPIRKLFQPREGDRLSITLAMPTDVVLPNWLRAATFWRSDSNIEVHAERQMPGRTLPALPTG